MEHPPTKCVGVVFCILALHCFGMMLRWHVLMLLFVVGTPSSAFHFTSNVSCRNESPASFSNDHFASSLFAICRRSYTVLPMTTFQRLGLLHFAGGLYTFAYSLRGHIVAYVVHNPLCTTLPFCSRSEALVAALFCSELASARRALRKPNQRGLASNGLQLLVSWTCKHLPQRQT